MKKKFLLPTALILLLIFPAVANTVPWIVYAPGNSTSSGDNIEMQDDKWIGLGASAGRIEFDNQTPDEISVLDANFNINAGKSLKINTSDDSGTWSFQDDGSETLRIRANDGVAGGFLFQTYSGASYLNALTITNSGNVGINTDNPLQTLDVDGNIKAGDYFEAPVSGHYVWNAYWNSVASSWTHRADGPAFDLFGTGAKLYVNYVPNAVGGTAISGWITAMALDPSNGYLGVGTDSPEALLHVKDNTTHSIVKIEGGSGYDAQIHLGRDGSFNWALLNDTSDSDKFMIYDLSAPAGRLVIDSDGNVGIGTTTPERRLEVKAASGEDGYLRITGNDGTTPRSWDLKADLASRKFSIIDVNLANTTRFVIDNNGYIGIGTDDPGTTTGGGVSQGSALHILNNDSYTDTITLEKQVSAGQPQVAFAKAGDSMAAVANGDNLGRINFRGYDGTEYEATAAVEAFIDGTVSTDTVPTAIRFLTTETNSKTERMRITSEGFIRFNKSYTPTSTSDPAGETGTITWDDNYLYVKTTIGWRRVALSSF